MNVWTRVFMEQAPRYGARILFDAIGPRDPSEAVRWPARLMRLGRGFVFPIFKIKAGKARRAQVVHICVSGGLSFWRGVLLLALVTGRRQRRGVLHLHSCADQCHPWALRLARRLAARRQVTLVTPNAIDARRHPYFKTIHNFVAPTFGEALRWQGPSAGPRLRLVYLGALIAEKGLFELLEALVRCPDATLDCYGPPCRERDTKRLQAMLTALHLRTRVTLHGPRHHGEVPALLCGYDALVSPSRGESFGLAAAEAMQLGVPVIATPVGFLAEAPSDTFVALGDDFAEGLASLAKDALARVGTAGHAYVAAAYGVEPAMRAWMDVYACAE